MKRPRNMLRGRALVGSAHGATDSAVSPDRIMDRRDEFRRRLTGLEPLVCGCPREGPPRQGCPVHDQIVELRPRFLFF